MPPPPPEPPPVEASPRQNCSTSLELRSSLPASAQEIKQDSVDLAPYLDGSADTSWFADGYSSPPERGVTTLAPNRLPTARQAKRQWFHAHLKERLPLPSPHLAQAMALEAQQIPPQGALGPCGKRWRDEVIAWAHKMVRKYQGSSPQVTGNWNNATCEWHKRMEVLQPCRAKHVMNIVQHGAKFPFSILPKKNMWTFTNHPKLREKSQEVWNTLKEQMEEGTVVPFDTRGAVVDGKSLLHGRLPKCMWSTAWRYKKHTSKVRITHNAGPLKKFFDKKDVTVDMEGIEDLRWRIREGDLLTGTDVHSAFFAMLIHEHHRTYTGHSYASDELPIGVAQMLAANHPECVLMVGKSKAEAVSHFKKGTFRICLQYRGLLMGASPSVRMLQDVYSALQDAWSFCPVGQGSNREQFRQTLFVDDAAYITTGNCYINACELIVRVIFEMIILGWTLSFHKCCIVPMHWLRHIGFILDARIGFGCRLSLPSDRADNITRTINELASTVQVGRKVRLKAVATVVGTLWSIHAVCHRAVAIMCRPLIRILAVALGIPAVKLERNDFKLRLLLKRIWRGEGLWTREAHQVLLFWTKVPFHKLWAQMRHDAVTHSVRQWVSNPDGRIGSNVKVFCSDSSDTGSGAAMFKPAKYEQGLLWKAVEGTRMYVRLTPQEIATSSCMREILGIERANLALVPPSCVKCVFVCDSQAALACLERGSRHPQIQAVVQRIFAKHLSARRVVTYVWNRRDTDIVKEADAISRWAVRDSCSHQISTEIFWKANDIAYQLWSKGFQLDAFADMHNVVPPDTSRKLPFFSRFVAPYAENHNAFDHHWKYRIAWVYAPFALLERIITLMYGQQARGAIVYPRNSKQRWAKHLRQGAEGVLKTLYFNAPTLEGKRRYQNGFAIAFVDFSNRDTPSSMDPCVSTSWKTQRISTPDQH